MSQKIEKRNESDETTSLYNLIIHVSILVEIVSKLCRIIPDSLSENGLVYCRIECNTSAANSTGRIHPACIIGIRV